MGFLAAIAQTAFSRNISCNLGYKFVGDRDSWRYGDGLTGGVTDPVQAVPPEDPASFTSVCEERVCQLASVNGIIAKVLLVETKEGIDGFVFYQ